MRSAFRLPDLSLRGLSLRTRLVVLLVALAVVGLAAAYFASYRALHNYLYDRVDQQLESAVGPVSSFLRVQAGETEAGQGFGPGPGAEGGSGNGAEGLPGADAAGGGPGGPGPGGHLPTTAYGQLRS